MADTTIIKVDSAHSPRGKDGQIYLATGANISSPAFATSSCAGSGRANERAPGRRRRRDCAAALQGRAGDADAAALIEAAYAERDARAKIGGTAARCRRRPACPTCKP